MVRTKGKTSVSQGKTYGIPVYRMEIVQSCIKGKCAAAVNVQSGEDVLYVEPCMYSFVDLFGPSQVEGRFCDAKRAGGIPEYVCSLE
jgi:hypothetical protein